LNKESILAKEESLIIFISKDKSYIKEYKISRNKFLIYTLFFLTIFLVSGNYLLDWLLNSRHDSKMELLERNNQFLKNQSEDIRKEI
jgi:hypothetical protein